MGRVSDPDPTYFVGVGGHPTYRQLTRDPGVTRGYFLGSFPNPEILWRVPGHPAPFHPQRTVLSAQIGQC